MGGKRLHHPDLPLPNGQWQEIYTLPCGIRRSARWYEWAHSLVEFCSRCGERHTYQRAVRTVERWIDTSVWYQPWTWDNGRWEVKPQPCRGCKGTGKTEWEPIENCKNCGGSGKIE